MIPQLIKIKETVVSLLEKYPHLRDDDNKLMATIWKSEIGKELFDGLSAQEFLTYFAEGRLSSAEGIRRARQKAQEQRPDLRGEAYFKRQKKGIETMFNINHA